MKALLRLAATAATVFGVRAFEVCVRYGFTLALALSLGASGAGQIYLGLAIVILVGTFARCGLDQASMRALAVAAQAGDLPAARGIVLTALGAIALLGGLLSLLLFLAAPLLSGHVFGEGVPAPMLRAIAFGVIGLALQVAAGAQLSALGRPIAGQIVSSVLWPMVAMAYLVLPGATATGTALTLTLAQLAAAALGFWLIRQRLRGMAAAIRPALAPMRAVALPLFGADLAQILMGYLPILALGLVASEVEIGQFGMASRLSILLTVLAVAMYAARGPRFAQLFAAGDLAGLERAARAASHLVAGAGLAMALVLWCFPATILGLMGQDFRPASPVLVILVAGQFAITLTSQAHALLVMTRHERDLWHNSLIAAAVLLVGLAVLLPRYEGVGAALAAAGAYAVFGLANVLRARQRLGINVLNAFRP
ncbi:hypothetical protein EJV46_03770 [Roseococcus sp. SYP-B2431]|uniref:lipopolysaccharide biosynthesis protein n=1 Tax=Roseococcus sp. SYP-B2431 TaxID=2496640 RepID=UPI00103AA244|nr:polysaccharide biosynthesis C-terminal domain-containing protein [Roseococcus sp. SYP-B2431]TCH99799.1 hypothetical protein EJV46_03770 [Roseococcus sp. SYP-B2431]